MPSPPTSPLPSATALASPFRGPSHSPSVHPQFRNKVVCILTCRHCQTAICHRGMKAILLGDTRVELYSTDTPPSQVQLVDKDYVTRNCRCKIRDVACLTCGNIVGYHVTQPCDTCLEACNNGHFWMFLSQEISCSERLGKNSQILLWGQLPPKEKDAAENHNDLYRWLVSRPAEPSR
ncbi:FAM72 protein-domain-containing protein [Polychytrium aggregatum]|uniref:FAM72 protein-domain-containing protein n=1 Tax=Polychytrium aggregatum TaxID=110093 RepID=UPI0022FE8201|nr:FAM72 protein-domain-containing protein [Polychytrium aggregatum]KAI9202429.1 FAM72 protein-domain-containing protein [Polychytrium aggregatum]